MMTGIPRQALLVSLLLLGMGAATAEAQRPRAAVTKTPAPKAARSPSALAPSPAPAELRALVRPAPDSFDVTVETTKGPFVIAVARKWAPRGADRFYYLVTHGYYDDVRFFRVVKGFMAQFGMSGDTAVGAVWRELPFYDDRPTKSNLRGAVSFATRGPNTRTTQLFVNLVDNPWLDARGFAAVGQVASGMAVVDSLYSGYGEGAPEGKGPSQERIDKEGNAYLARDFPQLDHIKSARVTWESKERSAMR